MPRYILRGAGRDAHFEYEVRLCAGGERYTLYRRYQRFRELHRYVAQRYGAPAAGAARLPPAKLFGRTSETLANERRGQLEVSSGGGDGSGRPARRAAGCARSTLASLWPAPRRAGRTWSPRTARLGWGASGQRRDGG